MTEAIKGPSPDYIHVATDIVSAYVSNNPVPVGELPAVIAKVHATITGLAQGTSAGAAPVIEVEKPTPAQIHNSVRPDGIVSFVDGRTYKTLKRHLTSRGLNPHSYRERYGLPEDYPMVAPSYAAQRSALAKSIGLGVPGALAEREESARRKAA